MTTTIPAGTWVIDPSHSDVSFTVKHLMVSKVRGRFGIVSGTATTGDDVTATTLTVVLDASTVSTGDENRDQHLRGEDFFAVESFPTATFTSTSVEATSKDDVLLLKGDLTIRDITRPVIFTVTIGGVAQDPYGQTKAAAEATTSISRGDFGLTWNSTLETGGVLVSDEVKLTIDAQAVLQA